MSVQLQKSRFLLLTSAIQALNRGPYLDIKKKKKKNREFFFLYTKRTNIHKNISVMLIFFYKNAKPPSWRAWFTTGDGQKTP